jgi:hypothetical protein
MVPDAQHIHYNVRIMNSGAKALHVPGSLLDGVLSLRRRRERFLRRDFRMPEIKAGQRSNMRLYTMRLDVHNGYHKKPPSLEVTGTASST